ncbi:MAG: glycosyltransferase family 2 protein [Hyphomonadaceae bacterium]
MPDIHQRKNYLVCDKVLTDVLARSDVPDQPLAPQEPLFDISNSKPLVTVIVPLFNEPIYVIDAITSLKRQSYPYFEVLIVDDASTDESHGIAHEAIQGDPRFQLVKHDENRGVNAARNTGLNLAKTPFITFLDADDILLQDAIEGRLGKFIDVYEERVGGVFGGIKHGPEMVTADTVLESTKWSKPSQTFISAEGECPFNSHAPLLRKDVLVHLGGFDEDMRAGAEDWEMWQRMLRHGYVFIPYTKFVGIYRARHKSRVRQMPKGHTELGLQLIRDAFAPMPSDKITPATPFVFTRPVSDYRAEMIRLKRLISYGAMAYMRDPDEFSWFLDEVPADVWHYAKYHFDVLEHTKAAIIRYLAATPETASQLSEKTTRIALSVIGAFSDATSNTKTSD